MSEARTVAVQPAAGVPAAGAFALPAEVTFAGANTVLEQAMPSLADERPAFDLSACLHFDSSLVGVLLELSRRASASGRRCEFVGASDNLRKLCGLYGVESLLFGAGSAHAGNADAGAGHGAATRTAP
ncbi:MAG: STAS domain-containing protein [Burkholderiaceae bacterium]|nr:STAS domain-containing protein [Burkholderiaceae bacterium]